MERKHLIYFKAFTMGKNVAICHRLQIPGGNASASHLAFILELPWAVGPSQLPSRAASRSPPAEGKLRHEVSPKSGWGVNPQITLLADTIEPVLCPGPCPGTYMDCHISSHKSSALTALWPLALLYGKVGDWQLFPALRLDTERSRRKVHSPGLRQIANHSFTHSLIHSFVQLPQSLSRTRYILGADESKTETPARVGLAS